MLSILPTLSLFYINVVYFNYAVSILYQCCLFYLRFLYSISMLSILTTLSLFYINAVYFNYAVIFYINVVYFNYTVYILYQCCLFYLRCLYSISMLSILPTLSIFYINVVYFNYAVYILYQCCLF